MGQLGSSPQSTTSSELIFTNSLKYVGIYPEKGEVLKLSVTINNGMAERLLLNCFQGFIDAAVV